MRTPIALLVAPLLILAACQRETLNPPTEPADPIPAPAGDAPPPPSVPTPAASATIVGRWAAQAAWCANTSGPQQPIEISIQRFEGYENSCAITSLDQVAGGYEATLACQAEGTTTRERIRMVPQGDGLRLTWLDRNQAVVSLVRCPAAPEPNV